MTTAIDLNQRIYELQKAGGHICSLCDQAGICENGVCLTCRQTANAKIEQQRANERTQKIFEECPIKLKMVVTRRSKSANNPTGEVKARRIGSKMNTKTGNYEPCVICRVAWNGSQNHFGRIGGGGYNITTEVQASSLIEIK